MEGAGSPGKVMGQTGNAGNADNQLKEQANSTDEKTREAGKAGKMNSSTIPIPAPAENVSAPENPKNEAKPAKRIIPL